MKRLHIIECNKAWPNCSSTGGAVKIVFRICSCHELSGMKTDATHGKLIMNIGAGIDSGVIFLIS